jgi:hypothetical protein
VNRINQTRTTLSAVVAIATLSIAPVALSLSDVPPGGLPSATTYGSMLLPELDGVVSWKTLALVEPVKEQNKIVPKFDSKVLALDGKQVRLQGFMLPMDLGEAQRHFLISAAPPHCPFCMPAGPEAVVEVFARKAITFSMEPIFVSGKLSLVKSDASGLLYRLNDADQFKTK